MVEKLDIKNVELKIGDLILIPKLSQLSKHLVLGFTEKSIILSCFVRRYENGKYDYRCANANISEHNDKYYQNPYPDMYIIERNFNIPENLRKFVKRSQVINN